MSAHCRWCGSIVEKAQTSQSQSRPKTKNRNFIYLARKNWKWFKEIRLLTWGNFVAHLSLPWLAESKLFLSFPIMNGSTLYCTHSKVTNKITSHILFIIFNFPLSTWDEHSCTLVGLVDHFIKLRKFFNKLVGCRMEG